MTFSEAFDLNSVGKIMQINYKSPVLAIHAAMPYLRNSNGQVGLIIATAGKKKCQTIVKEII